MRKELFVCCAMVGVICLILDDILPEINGKLSQVPTHHLRELWRSLPRGEGEVKYLLYGYVLLLNVTLLDNIG